MGGRGISKRVLKPAAFVIIRMILTIRTRMPFGEVLAIVMRMQVTTKNEGGY